MKLTKSKRINELFCVIGMVLFFPLWLADMLVQPNKMTCYRMEVVVTSKCTLKCISCANLMQYYRANNKHYVADYAVLAKDIEKLLSQFDYITCINVIGGEPLVYPRLYDVLNKLATSKKIGLVTIITNGTVKPNNEIMQLAKSPKIIFVLSQYPKEVAPEADMLVKTLLNNKVNVQFGKSVWYERFGEMGTKARGRTNRQLAQNFAGCQGCIEFMDGKLHMCPVSSHGTNLGLIIPDDEDYIDFRTDNIDKIKLKRLIRKPKGFYIRACDHCDAGIRPYKKIPAAIQEK